MCHKPSSTQLEVPTSLAPENFPYLLSQRLGELAYELAFNHEAAHLKQIAFLKSEIQQLRVQVGSENGAHAGQLYQSLQLPCARSPKGSTTGASRRSESSSFLLSSSSPHQESNSHAKVHGKGGRKSAAAVPHMPFDSITPAPSSKKPLPETRAESLGNNHGHGGNHAAEIHEHVASHQGDTQSNYSSETSSRRASKPSKTATFAEEKISDRALMRRSQASMESATTSVTRCGSAEEEWNPECDSGANGFEVVTVWQKCKDTHAAAGATGTTHKVTFINQNKSLRYHMIQDVKRDASEKTNQTRCARLMRHTTMDPCSRKRASWDILAFMLVIYDCIRIPLEFLSPPTNTFTETMVWITRLYWTFDCAVSFFTGYIKADGSTEFSVQSIGRRYFKTWFFPDIALITVDWLEVAVRTLTGGEGDLARVGKTARLNRIFRPLRLLRLVRIFRLSESFRRMSETALSEHFAVVYDIFILVIVVVGLAHIIACIWYGLGNWEARYGQKAWLPNSGMKDEKLEHKYFLAFHWSLAQFSGGMDEFKPFNMEERIFAICVMLLGIIILSICISGLTSAMTRLMIISSGPSRQLSKLRTYLSENGVSSELVTRIHRNARHILGEQARAICESDVELLSHISEPLQQELHFETRAPLLLRHSFFHRYCHACPDGMRYICHEAVSLKDVCELDLLFSIGERPAVPQMVFVVDGHLSYENSMGSRTDVFQGQWLSEATLWTYWQHCGTLSALTNCSLSQLNAEGFQNIAVRFSTADVLIDPALYAKEFVKRLNEVPPEELTDLDPTSRKSEKNLRRTAAVW